MKPLADRNLLYWLDALLDAQPHVEPLVIPDDYFDQYGRICRDNVPEGIDPGPELTIRPIVHYKGRVLLPRRDASRAPR